jgi:hypothetical protein
VVDAAQINEQKCFGALIMGAAMAASGYSCDCTAAGSMGLDPKHYAGHSLRIGGATAMTAADLSMYDKMQQGGWQSLEPEASLCYTRRSEAMEQRVAKALQVKKRRPLGESLAGARYFSRPRFEDRGYYCSLSVWHGDGQGPRQCGRKAHTVATESIV